VEVIIMDTIFVCYPIDEQESEEGFTVEQFVHRVSFYLSKQPGLRSYCYAQAKHSEDWDQVVALQIKNCDKLVFFAGAVIGNGQRQEVNAFREMIRKRELDFQRATVLVRFPRCSDDILNEVNEDIFRLEKSAILVNNRFRDDSESFEEETQDCARRVHREFYRNIQAWVLPDGLPLGYPFDYEKSIIGEFVDGGGRIVSSVRLEQGCPIDWPKVRTMDIYRNNECKENPLDEDEIGQYRDEKDQIVVDTRTKYHRSNHDSQKCCLVDLKNPLTLLEAGPREKLRYPRGHYMRVGIVVSGGIAPGIDSVIAGIVKRHNRYAEAQNYALGTLLYRDGFAGLLRGDTVHIDLVNIANLATQGGSMIGTSRTDALLSSSDPGERQSMLHRLITRLDGDEIDILYVIGGDGSMRAAHAIWTAAKQRWMSEDLTKKIRKEINVVAVPKTMDNDILWVWQAFGFLSAVEKAREFIAQIDTETKSNPRLCVMQLFGSDSGFVVSHAALASGVCKAALIPEVDFTMENFSSYICRRFDEEYRGVWGQHIRQDHKPSESPHGIILLAETAIPRDADKYIDNPNYDDLKLDESEKNAIREFIGSPLLTVKDIHKWKDFCQALSLCNENSLKKEIWKLLCPEIQGLVKGIAAMKEEDKPSNGAKSLIVRALNEILKVDHFYQKDPNFFRDFPSSTELKALHTHLTFLRELFEEFKGLHPYQMPRVFTKPNEFYYQFRDMLLQLSYYMLPYGAKEASSRLLALISQERMAIASYKQTAREVWKNHFVGYCKRLGAELLKTYNRILLQDVFKDLIQNWSGTGECRVQGQTPDALRSGGLKIVSGVLQSDIRKCRHMASIEKYWEDYRVFVNEPRHLIRSIPPSVSDVIFGQRLGTLAVDNAMAGYTDFMVSQWATEYVLVPLELVVLGRKRVPQEGIFWKSVLDNTGQWPDRALL
jgi:6-phosphofructokinase